VNLRQAASSQLLWTQPKSFSRFHELTASGELVGSLRFEKRSGSSAVANYGEAGWTFKRVGFFSPRVTVREAGSEVDLAVFTPSWTGAGTLQFASGRNYKLKPVDFWHTEWAFLGESGEPAVTLHGPHGLLKHGGETRIADDQADSLDTPVLVLMIWYLRLLMNEDAGAVAAITVATSG
jgi:hypothetical protein